MSYGIGTSRSIAPVAGGGGGDGGGDGYSSGWRLVQGTVDGGGAWYNVLRRKRDTVQATVQISAVTPINITGVFPEGFRSSLAVKTSDVIGSVQIVATDVTSGFPVPAIMSLRPDGSVTISTGDNVATQMMIFSVELDTDDPEPAELPGIEI